MEYKKRIADALLQRKFRGKRAVLIQGAKWCGKTTTAEQMTKSVIYMDDPQRKSMYLQLAEMNMNRLLSGDTSHLIDEWQIAPQIWDAVRYEVDSLVSDGVKTLNELANNIDTTKMEAPAFKMILTATGNYAYKVKDQNVFVVPIGCLKP